MTDIGNLNVLIGGLDDIIMLIFDDAKSFFAMIGITCTLAIITGVIVGQLTIFYNNHLRHRIQKVLESHPQMREFTVKYTEVFVSAGTYSCLGCGKKSKKPVCDACYSFAKELVEANEC